LKRPFRQKWMMILAAALSLSLLAAALASLMPGSAGAPRDLGETVSRPFLRLFSGLSGGLDQAEAYIQGMDRLTAENEALRTRLNEARQDAAQSKLIQRENSRLRALLDLRPAQQGLTLEPAQVIARVPDNWHNAITLDKGTSQGVQPGQCVVDEAKALVGLVNEVGTTWCTVSLLCDPNLRIAGLGANSGVLGTVTGTLEGLPQGFLAFTDLTSTDPIQLGEDIVTFAAQETYPSGLLVGTVTWLDEAPGSLTRWGKVTPAADLDALGQVFIITEFWEDH